MHIKSYCFRNWRYDPLWLQETISSSTCVPQGVSSNQMESEPLYPNVRCLPPRTQIKTSAQGTDERMLQLFISWTVPLNSNPFLYTFLPFKKGRLKIEFETVCWSTNLPSSQIAGQLNKGPTKIQSLSLLIGSPRWRGARAPVFLVSAVHHPSS